MKVLLLAVALLILMPVKVQIQQLNAGAYDEKLVAFEESLFTARKTRI